MAWSCLPSSHLLNLCALRPAGHRRRAGDCRAQWRGHADPRHSCGVQRDSNDCCLCSRGPTASPASHRVCSRCFWVRILYAVYINWACSHTLPVLKLVAACTRRSHACFTAHSLWFCAVSLTPFLQLCELVSSGVEPEMATRSLVWGQAILRSCTSTAKKNILPRTRCLRSWMIDVEDILFSLPLSKKKQRNPMPQRVGTDQEVAEHLKPAQKHAA